MVSKRLLLLTVLLLSFNSLFAQGPNEQLPNIVVILADDLGYGDVSSYNDQSAFQTPNIDELAEHGMKFTDAHTTSAVCTPTRYGLLTGRYNWRSRLKKFVLSGYSKSLIEQERLILPELLKQRSYQTAFVGKWHLGWDWEFTGQPVNIDALNSRPEVDFSEPIKNGPSEHGFDYSYGFSGSLDMPPYVYVENGVPTSIPTKKTVNYDEKGFWREGLTAPDFTHAKVLPHLTDKSLEYISSQGEDDQPFFLYYALPAPHTPILPTSDFIGKSNANLYGDFVMQVDHVVGQIVNQLEEQEMLKETLIIFTSDNGASPRADFEELARAGHDPSYIYRGHKADIYEGGHRVPFVVSWPGKIANGSVSDETISTVDLMATMADIIGEDLADDEGEDSYSFLPVLMQQQYKKPLREATVFHSVEGRFAIRKGDWKLILWPGSGGWSYPNTEEQLRGLPPFQLYNLEQDPSETKNLIHLYPEKVKELKALLEKYIREGRSTPGVPQENDGPERWAELDWMDL